MKYLTVLFLIILLSFSSLFAQYPNRQVVDAQPFAQGDSAQTIQQITGADSVFYRGIAGKGVDPTTWKGLTNTITQAEKQAETTQYFYMPDEADWHWYQSIQFKIEVGDSSITSIWVFTGHAAGRLTYAIKPDTSGTTTYYYDRLGGN